MSLQEFPAFIRSFNEADINWPGLSGWLVTGAHGQVVFFECDRITEVGQHSHGWQLETFDLSAYEGETAIVRFRFASDGYVSEEGWYVDDVNVTSTSTGVNDPGEIVPREFALRQNAPNPFNPVTTIAFALPEQADVSLKVYNMAGRVVRTLVNGPEGPGTHSVVWDGRDEAGRTVASGVYFYRMDAGEFTERRMMVLLK